ncbi:thiol-disulfide oxidoreductase DCC family protein [Pontiella agarivorans]|uniref:DCC1-like thiol-disulfide oxidoreductase family protein n=1 Tax=Pontiella agarivorans TaxID=3038953 RepID=A0ABU5MTX2_9BACT|nr:DCC1-like thiol-disulfide oxidoreductase family protein [Pontiella agarivorans]MDZ8117668.1 DCC1-like thiol-disulfide oxidoreductase family protein [Pontiella agarivorans]
MDLDSPMLILYDGDCPICCAKRDFLMRRDPRGALEFSDIRDPDFRPPADHLTIDMLAAEIHAVTPEHEVLRGMEVIRAAYRAIGIGWLAAPTGWRLLRPLFDRLYIFVAKNRLKISRLFSKSIR